MMTIEARHTTPAKRAKSATSAKNKEGERSRKTGFGARRTEQGRSRQQAVCRAHHKAQSHPDAAKPARACGHPEEDEGLRVTATPRAWVPGKHRKETQLHSPPRRPRANCVAISKRGRRHETVLDRHRGRGRGGWRGPRYVSRSVIAREITGAHWAGPQFFGLTAG